MGNCLLCIDTCQCLPCSMAQCCHPNKNMLCMPPHFLEHVPCVRAMEALEMNAQSAASTVLSFYD